MKSLKLSTMLMGLALFGFSGCGSSDSTEGTPDAGVDSAVGPAPFGISLGTWCYKVSGISVISNTCEVDFSQLISVPGNYEGPSTGIFTLGNGGKLGGGVVTHNQGTLIRKGPQTDPDLPGCSWNVDLSNQLTMTALNTFTVSVVENQDTITQACGFALTSCQTAWTGTFTIDAAQTDTANCK